MKRIAYIAPLVIGAAVLAGCGGGSYSGGSSGGSGSGSGGSGSKAAPAKSASVSVKSVSGVGSVLVDGKGFALYSPDQEKKGTIRCTGSCTSIWLPLTLPRGKSSPSAGASLMSKLGTVMRPDGKTQVTFDGKPLYRFAEDGSPGKVSGNGVSDRFGGKSFTWHVAATGKTKPSGGGGGGGGYGSYHY